jgi:hypothetical protein
MRLRLMVPVLEGFKRELSCNMSFGLELSQSMFCSAGLLAGFLYDAKRALSDLIRKDRQVLCRYWLGPLQLFQR